MLSNILQVISSKLKCIFAESVQTDMSMRIEAEQIRHIYSQTVFFVPAVLFGSLLTMIMFWPVTSHVIAISWCVWIWLIYIALWFISRSWKRTKVEDAKMHAWARPYIILSWFATAAWGSAGVLFFHIDSFVYQSILIIVLVIGSTAITATSTAYSPTFYPVVLMLLPLIIRLFYEEGIIYKLLATGLFVFTIALFFLHRNSHVFYAASLKQRFINEDLAAQLALQKDIAEQANISKSKFLAIASHDLRQPLHALNLFVGELRLKKNSGESCEDVIQHIGDSISGMNSLFNGLLDVSRFEVGMVHAKPVIFCVDELLKDLNEEYNVRALAKGLEFNYVFCSAVVKSDPLLLRRIVRNLLENSLRYTHKGRIILGCRRKSEFICLQVCDTGVGIAEANMQSIFKEFKQLDNPEGDHKKGVGLGLTVVKQLSQVLEHELTVASVPAKGTVFSLEIPLSTDLPVSTAEMDSSRVVVDNLTNACVLLLENSETSEVIKKTLLSRSCRLLQAADIDSARLVIQSSAFKPDVIISDYYLANGLSCIEVIDILCEEYTIQTKSIILVDAAELDIENNSQVEILRKPVNPVCLTTLLRYLLTDKK